MLRLTITDKSGTTSERKFSKREITVGRGEQNDVVLARSNISTVHLRIVENGASRLVIDNHSTNGTCINGKRIEGSYDLRDGDKIYIGDFILSVAPPEGQDGAKRIEATTASGRSTVRPIAPERTRRDVPANEEDSWDNWEVASAPAKTQAVAASQPDPLADFSADFAADMPVAATAGLPHQSGDSIALLRDCLRRYVELDELHYSKTHGMPCRCGKCLLCISRATLMRF